MSAAAAHHRQIHFPNRTRRHAGASAAFSATAAVGLLASFQSSALATTFTWVRTTSTSGSWSSAANWQTSDAGVAAPTPGYPLPDGVVNDIIFGLAGTTTSYSNTMGNDYLLHSITFPDISTSSLNVSGNAPAPPATNRTLYIGAGGVTANNNSYNVSFNSSSSTGTSTQYKLSLDADQTWTMNAPAPSTGAQTVTVNAEVLGTGMLTKAGQGILVFNSDSPNWTGGVTLNEGVIRLVGGTSGSQATGAMLGTGPVYATSNSDVSITSSSSSNYGQSDKWFGNHFYLDGTGTFTLGGTFNVSLNADSVVTLQSSKPIGASKVNQFLGLVEGPGGITQVSGGTLILGHANTYSGPTTFRNGTVQVSASNNLGDGSATNTLAFDGGRLQVTADLSTSRAISVGNGGGTVDTQGFNVSLTGVMTPAGTGTFHKAGTGTLTVSHVRAGGGLAVDNGTLVVAASGTDASVSKVASISTSFTDPTTSITTTGTLDLKDNDLIVDYDPSAGTPSAAIRQQLKTGRDGTSGAWTGPGIVSTTAKANAQGTTGIGYAEASDVLSLSGAATATWGGQTADASSLLLKYTYYGDANLDGKITPDDYALIDRGAAAGLTGWSSGDFDYDGVAGTASDYTLMDTAFLLNGGALSPTDLADRAARFGDAYVSGLIAPVPEPTSLAICALALVPAIRRRHRSH